MHVYKLVTVGDTIEEKLLTTLASKQDLANAALDMTSDSCEVAMVSGMEDLKKRLEVILDPRQSAPLDESQLRAVEDEAIRLSERREKVSQASSKLITAALSFASELLAVGRTPANEAAVNMMTEQLSQCVDRDEQGRPQLKITLPDDTMLRELAQSLATLLQPSQSSTIG